MSNTEFQNAGGEFNTAEDEYGAQNQGALGGSGDTSLDKGKLAINQQPKPQDTPIMVEPIKKSDLQPSYAHEMQVPDNGWYGSMINAIGSFAGGLGSIPGCLCCPNPFKSVYQGHVGLVTRFGQFYKAVDPGLVKVNPLSEKLQTVEVRVQVLDIPQQTCMTKDNVNIKLSSVMYFHIVSPHRARFGVNNLAQALNERTQTTLRHVVGACALQEIIERREEVAQSIREIIDDTASSWGVKIESILIKDLLLSDELQDSLAQAAKSKRAGESKIITARAEVESAKLMRRAADILASKAAMQIRYLEAMQSMAKQSNSKVIFMPSQGALENLAGQSGGAVPGTSDALPQQATGDEPQNERVASNMAYQEINRS